MFNAKDILVRSESVSTLLSLRRAYCVGNSRNGLLGLLKDILYSLKLLKIDREILSFSKVLSTFYGCSRLDDVYKIFKNICKYETKKSIDRH